jgi:hypothetical protein
MNHGTEFGHVRAVSASCRQRSTHLGAKICGAKPCYLGATGYGAEQRVQNEIKSSKGLNLNIFQKRAKIQAPQAVAPRCMLHWRRDPP